MESSHSIDLRLDNIQFIRYDCMQVIRLADTIVDIICARR